jgi:RecA-family ATPase
VSKLNLALTYARTGWHVFPVWSVDDNSNCRCGKSNDTPGHKPGKHPHGELAPHGHNDATTDEEMIRDWWTRDPDAGIGVSLAASGLLAVDIDPRNGGWESLAEVEAEHGKLLSTCIAKTQGGGEHRLFLADNLLSVPAQLAPGIDLKYNGYICVEGTRGPDGEYRWLKGASPLDGAEPATLPQFLRELCQQSAASTKGMQFRPGSISASGEVYEDLAAALRVIPPELEYNDWLKVLYGLSRLHDTPKAYALARDWSTKSKKANHTPEAFDAKWALVMRENSQTSYESIFYLANVYTPNWRTPVLQRKNPLTQPIQPFSEVEANGAELQPRVLVENYLFADLRNLIAAGGVGKTSMLLHEAVCGALGHPIWGNAVPKPFTTVFVTKEDSREILLARLREIMQAMGLSVADRHAVYQRVFAVDLCGVPYKLAHVVVGHVEPHTENLDALVEHCKPVAPDRIIFDPLVSFTAGESRINEAEQGIVEAARYLMRKLPHIAVDIVHHTGKMNARLGAMDQYAGRNGSALPDGSRMVAVMAACSAENFSGSTGCILDERAGEKGLKLSFPKMSYAAQPPDIYIKRHGFHFEVVAAVSDELRAHLQKVRKEAGKQETMEAIKASIVLAIRENMFSKDPLDRYPSRSRVQSFPGVTGKTATRKTALEELLEEAALIEREFSDDELGYFASTRVLAGRNTYVALPDEEL